jgi:hypothetical protein
MSYVEFNRPASVASVDQNFRRAWEGVPSNGSTGRRLYQDPPAAQRDDPLAFSGRRRVMDETMRELPDHSSRFSVYNGWEYGYNGVFPGKYATLAYEANFDPQPADCAPPRFYTNRYLRQMRTMAQDNVVEFRREE